MFMIEINAVSCWCHCLSKRRWRRRIKQRWWWTSWTRFRNSSYLLQLSSQRPSEKGGGHSTTVTETTISATFQALLTLKTTQIWRWLCSTPRTRLGRRCKCLLATKSKKSKSCSWGRLIRSDPLKPTTNGKRQLLMTNQLKMVSIKVWHQKLLIMASHPNRITTRVLYQIYYNLAILKKHSCKPNMSRMTQLRIRTLFTTWFLKTKCGEISWRKLWIHLKSYRFPQKTCSWVDQVLPRVEATRELDKSTTHTTI